MARKLMDGFEQPPFSCSFCNGVADAECTCASGSKCRDKWCLYWQGKPVTRE